MYLIFRCDCGRGMYAKEGVATRKCVCGKTIKVKTRRIIKKVEDYQTASDEVRDLQEEKYGGTFFTTADKVK
ncbi:MAG: DUF1922 domain-containing protein [Methanobacteriaceae archaeon]|jgi:hypothetical protein|nr:DUF1922 domain-containing protein [Methanobacteriaceae archaeon]PKL66816.1 MAG: DUF1922 domain-containing protein [Methanobacteriales archaeon HGW-Methanobacteriales-1]MDP2837396.1 DUF1922 domain-containing protein [Methanobacteriaceae archaeon]MDP3036019.1 DUF1922 domain-containing protein [Methanobacteriaceae archaeon]MDP3485329.1 DUF1922 domain-containing protein [Methanobacteriaceae archaeon]